MKENKRSVAVFDFDGTLTEKDTLLEFIKFACGTWQFYIGFLLYSPLLVLMKLHLYPNWKAKQKVFAYFFKGWVYDKFKKKGEEFIQKVNIIKNEKTIKQLRHHVSNGDTVYVISASIDEWVRPWCMQYDIKDVLGTKIEVSNNGFITGMFLTPNCYGQEKVNRLLQIEPHREGYTLFAYGDSRGDKELIVFADKGYNIKKDKYE